MHELNKKIDELTKIIINQSSIIVELTGALKNHLNKTSKNKITYDKLFQMPRFPINETTELYKFEKDLNDQHFFDQMSIRLIKFVYMDGKESVRRIFEYLISYTVANEFTWTGKNHIGGGMYIITNANIFFILYVYNNIYS